MRYIANIENQTFEIGQEEAQGLDLVQTGDLEFHLLQNNQSFQIEVIQSNFQDKTLILLINGNKYVVQLEDEYDQLVKQMGLSIGGTQKLKNIKAPMPGLILDILVKPDEEISKGTPLIILEAMKMENVLKAEGEGVIKFIEVEKGNTVEKGQVLIEMV